MQYHITVFKTGSYMILHVEYYEYSKDKIVQNFIIASLKSPYSGS